MKYYPLSDIVSTASQTMLKDFQYAGHTMFKESLDIFSIQKETVFGSQVFEDVDARITSVINVSTGKNLSDDFKQLIFDPIATFKPSLGYLFFFDQCFWLCTFTDNIKSVLTNIIVRRCNEQLRWIDENGIIYYEPCVIEYSVDRAKDTILQDNIITPQGYIAVHAQLNNRTENIHPNQRFLFGRPDNRICWRIFGNGIQNSLMQQTSDDTSSRVLTLTMGGYEKDQIQDVDNLVLGIADYYKKLYTLSFSASQVSGNAGETYLLDSTLMQNNSITNASLSYSTSSSSIATVSTSGVVTLISSGSATITGCLVNNASVTASATFIVNASPIYSYEVRISPSENFNILEGESQTFTTYLYANGSQQADAFSFALANDNVPVNRYVMSIIDTHNFSIENVNKYLNDPLIITATSGSFVKQIDIYLVGAW